MVGSNRAYWGHEFDISGSRDVVGHVIIRLAIVHFLLVVITHLPHLEPSLYL